MNQPGIIFKRRYPQSFLIKAPLWGTVVFAIILYFFAVVYQPLSLHGAGSLSFSFTMLLYCLLVSLPVFAAALLVKKSNHFSENSSWTVLKELQSIIILLLTIGVSAYFAGFVMESQESRWNIATFLDSFSRSVLIGVIPVLLPSLLNIRFALTPEIFREYQIAESSRSEQACESPIVIKSRAKKEELTFKADELIYAESDGNYVDFYLIKQDKPLKVTIRNSINEIELQLSVAPQFMRTHRAYIVNLKKVVSNNGNSLGYQLKLEGTNNQIPVSRQNTRKFDEISGQFLITS